MTTKPSVSSTSLAVAEVALAALGVATALSMRRLFVDWSFAGPLVLAVLGGALVAVVCRRRDLGLALSAVVSLLGLSVLLSLTYYRAVALAGFLPSRAVWDALWADVSASWGQFATAVAPVPVERGYVVAAVAALWIAAWLSDGFAFRAEVNVETLVPYGIVFVFTSALAADEHRVAFTAGWVVVALVTFALLRSLRDEDTGWLSARNRGAAGSALRIGGVLGVVAVAGAVVVGPALPGAGEEALVDTRNGGKGTRQVFSPLVDLKGRLTDQSETEAFRVRSERPQYWRFTALDQFDGRLWTSKNDYGKASGELRTGVDRRLADPLRQDVTITNLSSEWIPVAYSPESITIDRAVRFDDATSTVITRRDRLQPGETYTVISRIPRLTPEVLRDATGAPSGDLAERNLALPADFPASVRTLAAQVTAGAATSYDKALALQSYFRDNFTYDLSIPKGTSSSAIENFLEARRGYCEQFSGTFAAMARSVGVPARVAVGFTAGVRDGEVFVVQGKHAHAWPEVWFDGVGWVPFEPTPSRGVPGAETYTGIPAQQDGEPAAVAPTDPASTPVNTSPPTTSSFDIDPSFDGEVPQFQPTVTDDGGLPSWVVPVAVVLLGTVGVAVAWVLAVPALLRRRFAARRDRAGSNAERVLVAWHEAAFHLARAGTPPEPSETPLEYARRAAARRRLDEAALVHLAERATVAAYAPGDVPDEVVFDCDGISRDVAELLWRRADRGTRIRWTLDPRPLVGPLPEASLAAAERAVELSPRA